MTRIEYKVQDSLEDVSGLAADLIIAILLLHDPLQCGQEGAQILNDLVTVRRQGTLLLRLADVQELETEDASGRQGIFCDLQTCQ